MKTKFKALPIAVALIITGCANIEGEYLGGMLVVTKVADSEEQAGLKGSGSSGDGCGIRTSKYDQLYHSADQRWCANLTIPGGNFSEVITYSETVNVPVDIAYIRAKRELQFKDPDDKVSSIYNDHTQWDGIAGSYYGVKARYGGPLKNMLWYGDYDLQLEKIDNSRTKLRLEYKLYGRDFEPQSLRISLLDAIKES
ncbi:hypothetical protein [Marinobacter salarius]|jgi:hypothetical protein